jgi:uncharacterized protein YprB with RNaseH-like and TPR domain
MIAPVHKLKADQIRWLGTHYCSHGHTFLTHYACYDGHKERIGFFDIETSNLVADFGIMLSYSIKDSASDKIYSSVLTPTDIKKAEFGSEDKRLIRDCLKDLVQFDRIVTYYGSRFDVPFLRARALSTGLDFPNYGSQKHTDLYFIIRGRVALSSKRLENACRVLLGTTNKTRIDSKYWRAGVRGDQKSLAYILDHNKKDVIDLELLYKKMIHFSKPTDTSI